MGNIMDDIDAAIQRQMSSPEPFLKRPEPPEPEEEIPFGGQPAHRPEKEPMPKQKKIKHNIAPKDAKPLGYHREVGSHLDDPDEGWNAYSTKLMEENS